jgi:hypothetical protein
MSFGPHTRDLVVESRSNWDAIAPTLAAMQRLILMMSFGNRPMLLWFR